MIRAHYFYISAFLLTSLYAPERQLGDGEQMHLIQKPVLSDAKRQVIADFVHESAPFLKGTKLDFHDVNSGYNDVDLVVEREKKQYGLGTTAQVDSLFRKSATLTDIEKWLLLRAGKVDWLSVRRWQQANKGFAWTTGLASFGLVFSSIVSTNVPMECFFAGLYLALGSGVTYGALALGKDRCVSVKMKEAAIAASKDFDAGQLQAIKAAYGELHPVDKRDCFDRISKKLGLSYVDATVEALDGVIEQKTGNCELIRVITQN